MISEDRMAMPVKVSEAQIQGAKTLRRKVVRMPTRMVRKGTFSRWACPFQGQDDVVIPRRPEDGPHAW